MISSAESSLPFGGIVLIDPPPLLQSCDVQGRLQLLNATPAMRKKFQELVEDILARRCADATRDKAAIEFKASQRVRRNIHETVSSTRGRAAPEGEEGASADYWEQLDKLYESCDRFTDSLDNIGGGGVMLTDPPLPHDDRLLVECTFPRSNLAHACNIFVLCNSNSMILLP